MTETGNKSSIKDRTIIRAVPYTVVASFVLGLFLMFTGPGDVGLMLLFLFFPFVLGFAVLGAYSFVHREEGLLDVRVTLAVFILTPALVSLFLTFFTTYIMTEITGFIDHFIPIDINAAIKVFAFVYLFMLLMIFTVHGVISTMVAFLREYTARIYLSMELIKNDSTDTRRNKISRWIYAIPDIIDVEKVVLDPPPDRGIFPMKTFISLTMTIFVLGLIVSSYIFLNPVFENTLTMDQAVLMTVIMSFFIPLFVIPWFITRDIGAKIKSQARDYYLWKGMKKRLFEGFFGFLMLLSLLLITLYLGYDMSVTSMAYMGYSAITVFMSLLYSFIYMNYYHKGFKEGIINNFNEAKKNL